MAMPPETRYTSRAHTYLVGAGEHGDEEVELQHRHQHDEDNEQHRRRRVERRVLRKGQVDLCGQATVLPRADVCGASSGVNGRMQRLRVSTAASMRTCAPGMFNY
jgi:hypothetical protein